MLLAYEKGAALIVSVGAHFNLIEFLDENRGGMSSTFLTRLRIGETLVDAKGVSRLYNPELAVWHHWSSSWRRSLILLAIVVITSPALNDLFELIWLKIKIRSGCSARSHFSCTSAQNRDLLSLQVACRRWATAPLPRGLAGRSVPRARDRDPDRGRVRRRRVTSTRKDLENSLTGNLQDARSRADELNGQLGRSNEFAERVYPVLVRNKLAGRRIGVIALGNLPGDRRRRSRRRSDLPGRGWPGSGSCASPSTCTR